MKTVCQALIDEIPYPLTYGKVENIALTRGLDGDAVISPAILKGTEYKGALADCLFSLLIAVNFSEADKSVGALTDTQRKVILRMANNLYKEIGEPEKEDPTAPKVYINCDIL